MTGSARRFTAKGLAMKYLSLFSGIEAATVAWHPLGWTPVAFSEIDKTTSKFLAETYPHVPNLGDVTKITEEMVKSLGKIDLIIFGSPCQDLSIAGKQRGLDGARSGLFRNSVGIIQWARQHCGLRFALWENVPGAYSSNKGRDFTEVVASLAGLEDLDTPASGWGTEGAAVGDNGLLEWATLDARWFGLAARRKRVFALLDCGDWESRLPILLEPQGLRGDSQESQYKRSEVEQSTRISTASGEQLFGCLMKGASKYHDQSNQEAHSGSYHIIDSLGIRSPTLVESCRLMGFPDDYLDNIPDGYWVKRGLLGNSMAVPVIRHIGEKIMEALA